MNPFEEKQNQLTRYQVEPSFRRLEIALKKFHTKEENFLSKLDNKSRNEYFRLKESYDFAVNIKIDDALMYGYRFGRHGMEAFKPDNK